ncbi:gamma-parvin isoform X3 [Pangasianodon hypophthalmus]|uniref:gamma-parvin isoform X3 n=1 Tax=Pangasianodon hypophthalmus TaxID=310915 RepID=UPI002307233D|nr:gamma-parvin isoform X3 [Pangasianodon hypophthalmus]
MDKVVESEQGNQGERRKIIQPSFLNDPKLLKLKEVLVEWINSTLKPEHIVVQNLEEDIYDGLVLHHLLGKLGGVHLGVEEIALTSAAQMCKLELILQALNQELGLGAQADGTARWSAKLIHSRDLLATLHLLVALVKRYQPELALPQNVSVEVVMLEVNKGGIKYDKQIECITLQSEDTEGCKKEDPIDELLKLDAHKIATVKKALLHFINKNMSPLRLQVSDIEKQFADGVILILLIGELEGFFIPLYEFYLSPASHSEMLHNVTLALDLLNDREIQVQNVDPEDIVSQDVPATLKVLYALFKKHKNK